MSDTTFFSQEEARRIAERVLSFSTADGARVNISSGMDGNTRFAVNQMSTSGDVSNDTLTVTSSFGKRVASATTNRYDDEALRGVVATSEELARLVPEDPEYLGELGPQEYPDVDPYFPSTADLTPEERAQAIALVTEEAVQRNLISTGFLMHRAGANAVATSRGLFAYGRATRADFSTTVRTPDGTGSGWAGTSVGDWTDMDTRAMGATAAEKAEMSREPRAVEPGRWTVILEPTAVGNMVSLLVNGMGARAADEGRSFFSRAGGGNKIGEKVVDDRVHILSDPADPRILSAPFSGDGLPNRRAAWLENGVVQNLTYDRYWADRNGREPSGFASGWYMAGGSASIDEMIRSTERGLLITRFWYIRSVDPRTVLFTGLTRDGTFLVENGRITHPVRNLRWNESPVFMLNNIEMMGEPVRVSGGGGGSLSATVSVPPLKVRDFSFTSISDAI